MYMNLYLYMCIYIYVCIKLTIKKCSIQLEVTWLWWRIIRKFILDPWLVSLEICIRARFRHGSVSVFCLHCRCIQLPIHWNSSSPPLLPLEQFLTSRNVCLSPLCALPQMASVMVKAKQSREISGKQTNKKPHTTKKTQLTNQTKNKNEKHQTDK